MSEATVIIMCASQVTVGVSTPAKIFGQSISGIYRCAKNASDGTGTHPSSWLSSSNIVRCTSLSPPPPPSIRAEPMESISSIKIMDGACSLHLLASEDTKWRTDRQKNCEPPSSHRQSTKLETTHKHTAHARLQRGVAAPTC